MGAIAAISHVNTLCKELPVSMFDSSQDVFVVCFASVISFVLNDIYNGQTGQHAYSAAPSIVMMILSFAFSMAFWLYFKRNSTHPVPDLDTHTHTHTSTRKEEASVELADIRLASANQVTRKVTDTTDTTASMTATASPLHNA